MFFQVEVMDFGRERGRKRPCIKLLNWADTALAFTGGLKQFLYAVPQRGYRAHPSDHDSTLMHTDSAPYF
jgi:hypothetical protein